MSEMQARLECLKIAQTLSNETDGILAQAKRLYGFVASDATGQTRQYYDNQIIIESAGAVYQHP